MSFDPSHYLCGSGGDCNRECSRLLNELRERTEEVEKLNEHLEQRVTDQVDEIERMSRLRRFLPPQVADLIVASGSRSNSKAIVER